jgi:F-type H+-transporting ATPase subunit a
MTDILLYMYRFFNYAISVSAEAAGHAQNVAENAAEHAEETPELANWILIIRHWLEFKGQEHYAEWLAVFENTIFILLIVILISIWAFVTYRRTFKSPDSDSRKRIPKGFSQNFWEMIVQGLTDYTEQGLGLGKRGRSYAPFIGSLFLFILLNNLIGVIPLFKSSTSSLNTTLGLAVIVFITVQIHGIRSLGLWGWFKHLAGWHDMTVLEFAMTPLMLPLHVLGELIKPVSLSLRLFGNIFGEDILLAVFVGLVAFIPLQTPFYFLALLTSFIQTMVFTLLACSYIASMSQMHESHGEGEAAH